MKRPVKLGIASLKALGSVIVLGAVAHAGLPYLPLIGPPPLRISASKTPKAAVVSIAATPTATGAAAATNRLAVAEAKVFPGLTNSTDGEAAPGFVATTVPFAGPDADRSLEQTFSSSVFPLLTPNLLNLTPQMLATYFYPVRFKTNAAGPTGPFHVDFIPPLPPPDQSSRAEYIVK